MSPSLLALRMALPSSSLAQLKLLAEDVTCTPQELRTTAEECILPYPENISCRSLTLLNGIAESLLTDEVEQIDYKASIIRLTARHGKYRLWLLADALPFPLPNQMEIGVGGGMNWWTRYTEDIVHGGSTSIWIMATVATQQDYAALGQPNSRICLSTYPDWPSLYATAMAKPDWDMARQVVEDAPWPHLKELKFAFFKDTGPAARKAKAA